MGIAKEGLREILLSAIVLGLLGWGAAWLAWPLALPFAVLWLWVLMFFRDPPRHGDFAPGELCSPADGRVTEISELTAYPGLDGPVIRIGVFLSLFNVHVNRMPCAGQVRSIIYKPGEFLDARHPQSGERNESNLLLIDPQTPMSGPIVIRQVSGLVARRIICNSKEGDRVAMGYRFGLIKFGSRAELIIPHCKGTEILVAVGDTVKGGITVLARQPVEVTDESLPTQATTHKESFSAAGKPM